MEQNPLQKTRIEVVDALRGFAVMAIILVHNLEHFIFPVYPADSPEWLEVRHTPSLPFCLVLLFIFKRRIKSGRGKTSVTVSCGAWCCW